MALAPALGSGEGRAVGALRINLVSALVEVALPRKNRWLVRLAPLRIEKRTLRRPGTARERALATLIEMGVEIGGATFRPIDVYRHLGVVVGSDEYWAGQRAIDRMYRGDRGRAPELTRVGRGRYRRI